MKKLFTLLMAIMVTSMVFGQIGKPIYRLDNPIQNTRTDWYGNTTSEYFIQFGEGEIYFLTFPAIANVTTGNITKVSFGWQDSGTTSEGEVTFDPNFKVVIYTGGNTDWLVQNPDVSQATYYTDDATVKGTRVYEQTVDASTLVSGGVVTVNLTTPFDMSQHVGEQVWVGIECLGNTCGMIANINNPDYDYNWAINLNSFISSQTQAERIANSALYYTDASHTAVYSASYFLGAYIEDSIPYQPKSDWHAEIYDPEDQAQYPESITWLTLDQYTDSLYFYGGAFNGGIDSSYGMYYLDIFVDGETPLYFVEDEPINDEVRSYQPNYGMRWGTFALCGVDQFEEEGITLPFQLCFNVDYQTESTYNGVDPNLANNTYCITVSNEDPIAISENTNTLSIQPNPASTQITIDNAAGAQVTIYNISGQQVMSIEAASANETINVSNLSEGLYVVRVVNGTEVATSKVSIVR